MTKKLDEKKLADLAAGGGSVGDPNEDIEVRDDLGGTQTPQEKEEAQDPDNTGVTFRD